MESFKYRPLTIAEFQADIDILSGIGSTRKKASAQKKWLNTQSSAKKGSHFVPRIQLANDSPSDKKITNQFRALSVAELQADIDVLSGKKNSGSARKSINPKSRPQHFSAKYDKSDAMSKFYTKRVHSATIQKSIRKSIRKSIINATSKKDLGIEHSKIRKALTFGPEVSKIPQIRIDKFSSSSNVSTKGTEIHDLNTKNGNQMTKYKLSSSQKLYSPSATSSQLNIQTLARTLSETSRMSGVNVISNIARSTVGNSQNNRNKNENEGTLANPELSRISESPTALRLSKANTTSNSDESFLAREKEICYNRNEEIDLVDKGKDFTSGNQNLDKLLDISFDADDTLCFENSVIHKPNTSNGNNDYKNLQAERKINVLCDKLKKTTNKAAATAHKQHEYILQFKSKLETQRRILLRQNKHLQYLLNSNKEMLDAINDIVTPDAQDETIVMDETAKSPEPEEHTEYNALNHATTPPSSKTKYDNRRNSPVFVVPKKTSCLRKKILSKSLGAEGMISMDQVDDKPRAMYMQMKESWNFLQTPNKPNSNSNTPNLTQRSPFISFCVQRQLDKLYGKDSSQI